jgi:predicted amidophosphoribosyltransferase
VNKRDFLIFCENYYGEKYDGIQRDVMSEYLDGKPERFFDAAAYVLVKRFSRAARIAPGPAEIEKYLDEILDTIPVPVSLPKPEEERSGEEQEEVAEMFRRFTEKFSIGVRRICFNCRKPFTVHSNSDYCPECLKTTGTEKSKKQVGV